MVLVHGWMSPHMGCGMSYYDGCLLDNSRKRALKIFLETLEGWLVKD